MQATHDADNFVEDAKRIKAALLSQIGRRIVGQEDVIELMLISLFARGHCLFVGVPGLAKTLLVNSTAQSMALQFQRIQFTPDLMPSDITGTEIIEEDQSTGRRHFKFIEGPIFTNLLLADEINRTPPKTQAALLQAMQEGQVTASGKTHALASPFMVFATQNPIEQEGTYPLPEAQLDRFMLMIQVDYPTFEDEMEVVRRTTYGDETPIDAVLSPADLVGIQNAVRQVPVSDHAIEYAVQLVRRSRPTDELASQYVRDFVGWGAGPRASQNLILAGKSRALLNGRRTVSREDIRALAGPVLRHRVVTNFHAEAEKIDSAAIIQHILDEMGHQ
ncbi:MAG: MoxR family ATPase [Myxococcota bacterium]|nr:MoxR family ATPase [Myxococcota bacterium]